jgi:hypothetical protein
VQAASCSSLLVMSMGICGRNDVKLPEFANPK